MMTDQFNSSNWVKVKFILFSSLQIIILVRKSEEKFSLRKKEQLDSVIKNKWN
jgi:hypothetical protein